MIHVIMMIFMHMIVQYLLAHLKPLICACMTALILALPWLLPVQLLLISGRLFRRMTMVWNHILFIGSPSNHGLFLSTRGTDHASCSHDQSQGQACKLSSLVGEDPSHVLWNLIG